MTVSDDITDEMLEHVIKSDGLVSTPFYKDICAELLQRRQADRWIPVSENLPEGGKYVLASKGKSVIEAKYYYFSGNFQLHGWYKVDGMFLGVSWAEYWKEKPAAPEAE